MSWLELDATSLRDPTFGDNAFGALSAEKLPPSAAPGVVFSGSQEQSSLLVGSVG